MNRIYQLFLVSAVSAPFLMRPRYDDVSKSKQGIIIDLCVTTVTYVLRVKLS